MDISVQLSEVLLIIASSVELQGTEDIFNMAVYLT